MEEVGSHTVDVRMLTDPDGNIVIAFATRQSMRAAVVWSLRRICALPRMYLGGGVSLTGAMCK